MDSFDQLHRYLFDQAHVRGELVQLHQSYQSMLQDHNYPMPIRRLLGELMAATSLLTATLKFEGEISLQLQSEGLVKYAVINGTHEQKLRGIARWDGELPENDFSALFHKGVMVITITPDDGERYQGVVALEEDSLAGCLEAYFEQSEQLPTKVILHTSEQGDSLAAGMLLQVLPVEQQKSRDDFEHLSKLTETVKAEEMLGLKAEELLYRLYHQEEVELFEPQPVVFECSCSKERSSAALASVDKQELLDIIAREGKIAMNCQYCNQGYEFDAIDVEAIHAGQLSAPQQPQ